MTPIRQWWRRASIARASWADDLDFVGPRVRTSPWSWLVLALGALALMVSVDAMDQVQGELDDAAVQAKRLSQADRQVRLARAVLQGVRTAEAAQTTAPPALQGAHLVEVLGMARLLAYPWDEALNRVDADASAHQAVLLAMSVDLDKPGRDIRWAPTWRVQAAVRDDASALGWSGQLPGGRILARDRLGQPFVGARGSYELKVDAQMHWSPPPAAVTPSAAQGGRS